MRTVGGKCEAATLTCAVLALALFSGALGCSSPAAIGVFAENTQKALQPGPTIFGDLKDSCVRRHLYAKPITPLFLPASGAANDAVPACAPFDAQVAGLNKTSEVLTAYFRAMQQLASFNASTVSTAGQNAAANAATAANLNTFQIDSAGKLAGLISQLVIEGARRHELLKLLREADPAVAAITQGFEDVTAKDYQGMLREEQRSLAARYQNVTDVQNLPLLLALNRAYSDDLSEWTARKRAAEAYVGALQQIREGHHKLAENAGHLNARQLGLAIQPYTTQLQALIPILQKEF